MKNKKKSDTTFLNQFFVW